MSEAPAVDLDRTDHKRIYNQRANNSAVTAQSGALLPTSLKCVPQRASHQEDEDIP